MTAKRRPQSPDDIAALKAEIRRIEAVIKPLHEELTYLRRHLATITAGQVSAEGRSAATADRNERIIAEAREILGRRFVPYGWQRELARVHHLSPRQIRRILEIADINIEA